MSRAGSGAFLQGLGQTIINTGAQVAGSINDIERKKKEEELRKLQMEGLSQQLLTGQMAIDEKKQGTADRAKMREIMEAGKALQTMEDQGLLTIHRDGMQKAPFVGATNDGTPNDGITQLKQGPLPAGAFDRSGNVMRPISSMRPTEQRSTFDSMGLGASADPTVQKEFERIDKRIDQGNDYDFRRSQAQQQFSWQDQNREDTQGFTAGEGALDRASRERIAGMQGDRDKYYKDREDRLQEKDIYQQRRDFQKSVAPIIEPAKAINNINSAMKSLGVKEGIYAQDVSKIPAIVGTGSKIWRDWLNGDDLQGLRVAVRQFVTGDLKRISGAAVSDKERDVYERSLGLNTRATAQEFLQALQYKASNMETQMRNAYEILSDDAKADIDRSQSIFTHKNLPSYIGGAPAQTQQGAQVGDVEDGYRFKGGDPSDPNNWERVN
jgi:hypothetical protein